MLRSWGAPSDLLSDPVSPRSHGSAKRYQKYLCGRAFTSRKNSTHGHSRTAYARTKSNLEPWEELQMAWYTGRWAAKAAIHQSNSYNSFAPGLQIEALCLQLRRFTRASQLLRGTSGGSAPLRWRPIGGGRYLGSDADDWEGHQAHHSIKIACCSSDQ